MTIEQIYEVYRNSSGVCTDTRNILQGGIFFALKGETFNGNSFAREALSLGAKYAVIDEPIAGEKDERIIETANVLQTLQNLATHHRRQFNIPVLGITGSNGKTTTKELVSSGLARKYQVHTTQGNFNNHIGVPLTLLSMPEDTEIAVIEMGANHVGEIAELCRIAEPNYGLITNIGHAHIEGFGGFEGVIRGKSELYHHLIQNQGTVFINSNNEILMNMSKRFEAPVLYPNPGDYFECFMVQADPFVQIRLKDGTELKSQLIGAYNFDNLATALCVGTYFDVPQTSLIRAMEEYIPSNNRSQLIDTEHNHLILDAYNANPNSMSAALENLASISDDKKSVILGDMLELGEASQDEHRKIGLQLKDMDLSQVLICGPQSQSMHLACPGSLYFSTKDELENYLKDNPIKNQTILLKASRAIGLETLVEYL